jgi:hypothetical protein
MNWVFIAQHTTFFIVTAVKNLKALAGWTLYWRRNVFPMRYELGFNIPEDDILHGHRRENLKSYIALTGWDL